MKWMIKSLAPFLLFGILQSTSFGGLFHHASDHQLTCWMVWTSNSFGGTGIHHKQLVFCWISRFCSFVPFGRVTHQHIPKRTWKFSVFVVLFKGGRWKVVFSGGVNDELWSRWTWQIPHEIMVIPWTGNHPTNQPSNQPTNQPTNHPTNHTTILALLWRPCLWTIFDFQVLTKV